jgi:succinyl-CoA synthetase alpha subunit
MLDYGTKVVTGVTPGRGGETVKGVPVFDTIAEAKQECMADASIIFVPARFALDPALEAIEGGLDPVIIITENIPIRDTMEIVARARLRDTTIVGPNTPGLIRPGASKMGIMPSQVFRKGPVGVGGSRPHHEDGSRPVDVRRHRRRPHSRPRLRRRPQVVRGG